MKTGYVSIIYHCYFQYHLHTKEERSARGSALIAMSDTACTNSSNLTPVSVSDFHVLFQLVFT